MQFPEGFMLGADESTRGRAAAHPHGLAGLWLRLEAYQRLQTSSPAAHPQNFLSLMDCSCWNVPELVRGFLMCG